MENKEEIQFLSKLIDNIKSGKIELINLKEKKNKDLTWSLSIKILVIKEIEEFKKHSITIEEIK
jgi:hypothetical protein